MSKLDLVEILNTLVVKSGLSGSINVKKICDDHRKLEAGDVFVAIRGAKHDGHGFLKDVFQKKPAAVIVESMALVSKEYLHLCVQVKNSRLALDKLAHAYFDFPSEKLFCVAVTGTSGKTTTSYMVAGVLNGLGIPTGVIGTNNHNFKNKTWDVKNTTPGSLELYGRLQEFLDLGAKGLSMEASSHAIDQDRLSSLDLDVGIFSNLSRDHLDYHPTFEDYFKAKNKLFSEILKYSSKKDKHAIINISDSYGNKVSVPNGITKITYGTDDADLSFKILKHDFSGVEFEVGFRGRKDILKMDIPGHFNVLNALSALGAGLATGTDIKKCVSTLQNYKGVRGRLESIPNKREYFAFVDYAHKPDALENVLRCLNDVRGESKSKIITVFGCGGDRDKGKRPIMAKIAARLSDFVVVTSDNPRTEDPEKIIEDIKAGFDQSDLKKVTTEVDRTNAMKKAIEMASPRDVILVAGKGHETYQIIGNETIDFDDAAVLSELLN